MAPTAADEPAAITAPAILVLADDPVHHRPPTSYAYVVQALEELGLPYKLVDSSVADFEEALLGDDWDLVIMANDQLEPTKGIFGHLDEYVRKGGRLIIHTWAMEEVADEPLWETLGVKWNETLLLRPKDPAWPLFWWEPDHPIFNDPNPKVPEFKEMANLWEQQWPVEHAVDWNRGFEPLAGYKEGVADGSAGMVLSGFGVTVFRGFVDFIIPVEADANDNKIPDAVELWQNLIMFVLEADPRPSSFSKSAPANNAADVLQDVLLDWNGSSGANRYAYCIDQVLNTTCDTSWKVTTSSSVLVKNLQPNTDYYWQARAENLYGVTYANSGTWWHFTTGDLPITSTFLPVVLWDVCASFPGPRELEPNDTPPQANGLICHGQTVAGDPDDPNKPSGAEDQDWFKFDWSGQGTLQIEVTNFLYDAQVILYDPTVSDDLDKDYWKPDGHYQISYPGQGVAGIYYVLVFAPEGHPVGNGDYALTVNVQ